MRSEKVFDISPTTNSGASYTIGLYFTTAELAGFDPATLQIAKTDAATIGAATAANTIIAPTTYIAYANGYLFTASFTGFSQFFLESPGVALPVTLLTFNGNLDNNNILLNWRTSSEQGSKYFDIEKSQDGTNFTTIGKLPAAGTSSSERVYHFTDRKPYEYNYYRLKMINIDGKFTYSGTILIKNLNVSQLLWVGNNPFHDIINIHLAKIPQQSIKVELINESGARVYFKEFTSTNFLNVDVSKLNMASGVYILRTAVDGKIYTNKLLKQ